MLLKLVPLLKNKKEKNIMKKNVILKSLLLLTVISIMIMGFTGCGVIINPIPTTGTVYINIANDNYVYDVYVDNVYQGQTDGLGNITLTNVLIGSHYFQVYDTSWWALYGSKTQYIYAGTNTVTIYTY